MFGRFRCLRPEIFAESAICNFFSDVSFVKYMESVYAYMCANTKLDPDQGVELSAAGIIAEVNKMKQDESAEVQLQIQKAQEMAADTEPKEVDDDKSEDWTPSKGK